VSQINIDERGTGTLRRSVQPITPEINGSGGKKRKSANKLYISTNDVFTDD
jgi:hypothetical protein